MQKLLIFCVLNLLCISLISCGQKGSLYLPDEGETKEAKA